MRKLLTSTLVLAAAAVAFADGLPDGIGTVAPNGSVFTTEITPADVDDYVFLGHPGMKLTTTVKAAKGSALVPDVTVLRPDGTVVGDEQGLTLKAKPTSVTAAVTLDAIGWWKVRVRGANATVGAYSVSVKYTSPVLPQLPLPSKGFAVAGAIDPAGDDDTFAFQGYEGQSFTATLTVPKTSALDAAVQVIRPDGSEFVTAGRGTLETKIPIASTLDESGTWHIKVFGEEVDNDDGTKTTSTGAYTLAVKLGRIAAPGLTPDGNGQYRFTIPAAGGDTIAYKVTWTAPQGVLPPTFNSIVGPDGQPVIGFPGGTSPRPFVLPTTKPVGFYTVTIDAPPGAKPTNVRVARTVVPARGARKRVAKLSNVEPIIRNNGINPTEGGPGTLVTVLTDNFVDPNFENGVPDIQLGHIPLEGVEPTPDGKALRGSVPTTLPEGVFDVVVMTTSGQAGAKAGAFRRVPPPVVTSVDPNVGTASGGFPITIYGSNFRPGHMSVRIESGNVPAQITETTESSITFISPLWHAGNVSMGVQDNDTQLTDELRPEEFEYVAGAAIGRLVPSLVPILGGELITIQGANFNATDSVYLETTTPGVYEQMSSTFVSSKAHQFTAPIRPKGRYRVYVQEELSQPGEPKTRDLFYYTFADFTPSTNLGALGTDQFDGITTALADFDGDGDQDLIVTRRGNPADAVPSATSLTRILRNEGNGTFADRTASVMPATTADDWRADRIWAADVNQDGRPDLILSTNAKNVPEAGLSHTRILINEPRGGSSGTGDRVFRDRTIDLMAPPREMQKYGVFGGDASYYVADDWRGLDMWVGDIDKGGPGPPEIVITHDEVKDDDNPATDVFMSGVYCGNYCSSVQTFAYSYTFYWGGSRLFVWDKSANQGQGRYKFDSTFFPRKSGPVVPQALPGGGTIPPCSPHYGRICKGSFTPFTGKRVAVGNLDTDGKPDIAVLSDQVVQRSDVPSATPLLQTTSSLQVGINKFNPAEGSGITDVTKLIFNLGGITQGDAVAIGQPGYPDGNSYGVIAFARQTSPGGGSVLRLVKFKPGLGIGDFEDITTAALAAVDATDQFQASRLAWIDADGDGDQDLVLLAPAPPAGTGPALRILRNERSGNTVGNLRRTLFPLFTGIVTPTEHFEGDALSIGDLTGDGVLDYIVTRATPTTGGTQTRIIKTDR